MPPKPIGSSEANPTAEKLTVHSAHPAFPFSGYNRFQIPNPETACFA
jgi:hypothetical protein